MPRQRRLTNCISNHGDEKAQKKIKKSAESKLQHMEICDRNDTEFKITVLKILNKMQ